MMWHLRLENLESGDHLWNGSFLSEFMDFRHCFFRLDFKLPLSVIIYNMSSKKQKEIHVFFQIPGDNYQQSVKTRFFHSYLIQISIGRLRGTHKTHLLNCLINLHVSLSKLLRNNLPAFPGGSLYARVVTAWMESCSIHWSLIPRGGV